MTTDAIRVREWLERIPASDASHRPRAPVSLTWDEWASAGRRISGIEDHLMHQMLYDRDPVNRAAAAMALGFVGSDNAVAPLTNALKNDVPHVAMEAAASLGRIGRVESVQALCEALDSPDLNVQASAATALGNFSTVDAEDCLKRAAMDRTEFVRLAVEEALRRRHP